MTPPRRSGASADDRRARGDGYQVGSEPDVEVRPLVDTDLDRAAEVLLAARHAAVPSIPPLVHSDDDVRGWVHQTWPGRTWVVTVDGEVDGVLVLEGQHIDQLYVEPSRAGQGLGSLLLAAAKAERPDGLSLWVFASNMGARRLYARHGFVEVEETDGSANEERSPDVRCVWSGGP